MEILITMLKKIKGAYRWCNVLSIDVALGAWACGSMFARHWGVEMPWAWHIVLPLAVWLVYTADHLWDAYQLQNKAVTYRHLYHYKHLKVLARVGVGLGLFCLVLALFLPLSFWVLGVVLGLFILFHFLMTKYANKTKSAIYLKEWSVGLIYSLGVSVPVMLWKMEEGRGVQEVLSPLVFLPLLLFFALVIYNLCLFAHFDRENDRQSGQHSWVLAVGEKNTNLLFVLVEIITFWGVLIGLGLAGEWIYWKLGAMLGVTFIIRRLGRYFERKGRYRLWGDAVFLIGWV